jgi:hypothetical protein
VTGIEVALLTSPEGEVDADGETDADGEGLFGFEVLEFPTGSAMQAVIVMIEKAMVSPSVICFMVFILTYLSC